MIYVDTLQEIKDISSSNEKLSMLRQLMNKELEFVLRAAYDDNKFGLSKKTLMKVYDISDLKGFEDVGAWVADKSYVAIPGRNERHATFEDWKNIVEQSRKLSGKNLLTFLEKSLLPIYNKEACWIIRTLLKDMRIGMSHISINKIFSEFDYPKIDKFVTQLCGSINLNDEKDKTKIPVNRVSEIKWDGTRTIAKVGYNVNPQKSQGLGAFFPETPKREVKLFSRSGEDTTETFPEIVKALLEFADENRLNEFVLDGEIISKDFNSLQHRLGRKAENLNEDSTLSFNVFDILEYNGISQKSLKLSQRKSILEDFTEVLNINIPKGFKDNSVEELIAYYNSVIAQGHEGIIIKDLNSTYAEDHLEARKGWFKVKPNFTGDFRIVGASYGTGANSSLISSLEVKSDDGKISCSTGSGITDKWREILTERFNNGTLLGTVVELKYFEILKSNKEDEPDSLRFPIFRTLRDDKKETDSF